MKQIIRNQSTENRETGKWKIEQHRKFKTEWKNSKVAKFHFNLR